MNTETQELELVSPEAPADAPMKQLAPFDAQRLEAEKLKKTAETLVVSDINDNAGMQLARTTRLALKAVRVAIEHRRKELTDEALRTKQAIDTQARELKETIEELEERLLEQEEFAKREAEKELAARVQKRTEKLAAFWNPALPMPDLGALTPDQFETLLEDTETTHKAKVAAAEKAEADRIAKEKADAEERERVRLENIRLKEEAAAREEQHRKEAAERDRLAKIENAIEAIREGETDALRNCRTAQAVRDEIEYVEKRPVTAEIFQERLAEAEEVKAAVLKSMRAILASREQEERAVVEREAAQKKATAELAETQRKTKEAQAIADAAAKKEREAREKAEAELAAKKADEEAKRKAAEQAAKKAARAPDKQKAKAFAAFLLDIERPTFTSAEGKSLRAELDDRLDELADWLEGQASNL